MNKIRILILLLLILVIISSCEKEEENIFVNNCENTGSCPDAFTFTFPDLNETSSTYCTSVGPETWNGEIRLFYFSTNEQ